MDNLRNYSFSIKTKLNEVKGKRKKKRNVIKMQIGAHRFFRKELKDNIFFFFLINSITHIKSFATSRYSKQRSVVGNRAVFT